MKLLVTRPADDAAPLAKQLEELGHDVVLEPLLDIALQVDAVVDLDGVQALLFTSANGVRAFAKLKTQRDLPVFAVGDSTARSALEAGFSYVESADGDVADLARLVTVKCEPAKGALLHPAASSVAGDLSGLLGDAGFEVRRTVIYEARKAKALSDATIGLLKSEQIDGALFFSPRTAESFASLAGQANITDRLKAVTAFALSKAVAGRLDGLPFKAVRVAARPDQDSLLLCIDEASMTSDVEETKLAAAETKAGDKMTPPPLRSTKKSLTAFLIGGVLGIALVAGAGAALWPMLVDSLKGEILTGDAQEQSPVARNSDAVDSLSSKDRELEKRVAALESNASSPGQAGPGVAPEVVAALNERVAKLEQELVGVSARRDAGSSILVAALMLREANNAGRSLTSELDMLAKLAKDNAAMIAQLDTLTALNGKGIVPAAELEKRFYRLKPQLLRSTMDENENLWDGILRRLSVLISIRRTDEQPGEQAAGLEGAVAHAEAAIERHDLNEATVSLATLVGPAGLLVGPWLEDAQAHIQAEKQIQALLDAALSLPVKP